MPFKFRSSQRSHQPPAPTAPQASQASQAPPQPLPHQQQQLPPPLPIDQQSSAIDLSPPDSPLPSPGLNAQQPPFQLQQQQQPYNPDQPPVYQYNQHPQHPQHLNHPQNIQHLQQLQQQDSNLSFVDDPQLQQQQQHQFHPDPNLVRRSQSLRSSGPHSYAGSQPTVNLVSPNPGAPPETITEHDLVHQHQQTVSHDSNQLQNYPTSPPPPPQHDTASHQPTKAPKSKKRGFFGFGHSNRDGARPNDQSNSHLQPSSSQNNSSGLSRRVSLRRREQPDHRDNPPQTHLDQNSQHTHFTSAHSSVSQLPPSVEENLDPHLAAPSHDSSPITPQEYSGGSGPPPFAPQDQQHFQQLSQQQQQQYQHQDGQQFYEPPQQQQFPHPLQRQLTDPSHSPREGDSEFGSLQQTIERSMPGSTLQAQDGGQGGYTAYRPTSSGSSTNLPADYAPEGVRSPGQQFPGQGYQAYNPPGQNQRGQGAGGLQQGPGGAMPHPADSKARRSGDAPGNGQTVSRDGSTISNYGAHGQGQNLPPGPNTTVYSPPPGGPTNSNYRGGPPQQQAGNPSGGGDHGRNTPPVGAQQGQPSINELEYRQILQEKETLQQKYSKVKKLYFERNSQVENLQNTLANQRMSTSRTALDDNEYVQRFQRLDGAINNLAFNIRKDWKHIPHWLQPCVNQDAAAKATKEMTVVGRAAISRWITDEILDAHFHPGLDETFSTQLKRVEKSIRRLAPPCSSNEEEDALLAKVAAWRLTTLDGLADVLASPYAKNHRQDLTHRLITRLLQSLKLNLVDPAPMAELESGIPPIIDLAVGIAANLPLESRDVCIEYFMPGTPVSTEYMKTETALPPLTNPGPGPDADDPDHDSRSTAGDDDGANTGSGPQSKDPNLKKKAGGIFSSGSASSGSSGAKIQKKGGPQSSAASTASQQQGGGALDPLVKGGPAAASQVSLSGQLDGSRVRMAGFIAVEVRGKSILYKAPVWTT